MSIIHFKSRLLAVLACVLCALSASAYYSGYDFYQDTIYYKITGTNTVEVVSKASRVVTYSGDVVIPQEVTYEGVTYTVQLIGGTHPATTLDEDQTCIFRIATRGQKIKVTASKNDDSYTRYFTLGSLTLES